MKLTTTQILYATIAVLTFLLLRQCSGSSNPGNSKVKVERDTTYLMLKGKPDTIYHYDTVYNYIKLKPDTVYMINDSISMYSVDITDTLLEGKIESAVVGKLLWNNFKYTPKFPTYIKRVDTLKKTITVNKTITKNPWEVYLGMDLGAGQRYFDITPSVLVRTPYNLQVGYGYGLFNKSHNAKLYHKLSW